MKILLLHSEDDPENGPWSDRAWDRIVDAGLGGLHTYERWSHRFKCPATTLNKFHSGFDDFRRVRRLMDLGCGRLVDEHGLDWWELLSMLLHVEMEMLILLQHFVQTLESNDKVYVSRPGPYANLLQGLLPTRVHVFPWRRGARGLGRYVRVLRKLSTSQIIDVCCDKYDLGYQVRARLVRRPPRSKRPVVLLPTAYVNVSRTGIAYANTFPQENFLLVATRRSGWLQGLPANMAATRLSMYASLRDRNDENAEIARLWQALREELEGTAEFEILGRCGYLDKFPVWLRHGFEVRDAWRNVLDTEPVQAVLCSDDSNPFTRMPLLLAQALGLPNIACHHGAVDGRYFFKRSYGDVVWAKGKMEQDYLVEKCGVPQEKVEVAAPALPASWNLWKQSKPGSFRPNILFISESVDAAGGRPEEFYRDVLPALADLALATDRKLIVKLHPIESPHERSGIVARILSRQQKDATQIVTGPLTEDLLSQAWFAITILSTVAVECAVRGIPCFLCRWLNFSPYGYQEQFIRFGVGIRLESPSEIEKIPQYLSQNTAISDMSRNWWQPVAPGRLQELLASYQKPCAAATG